MTEAIDSKCRAKDGAVVGEIGEVMHLAKSGRLIVRINKNTLARPGELLVDENGKRIGRIAELMGPTAAPFASVIPMTDRVTRLVGSKVSSGGFAERKKQNRALGRRKR